MKRIFRTGGVALTLAAAPAAADTIELERVEVSASSSRMPLSSMGMPATITVIDPPTLQDQLALTQDLSQVLSNLIPSFSPPRQKLTNAGETLRGRKPLYLVDGVPQSTPLREGGRDGHTVDPAMIERIEVIHGANSLQGLGASGGIINLITKQAPREDGALYQDVSIGLDTALPRRSDGTGYRGSYLLGTRRGTLDFVGGVSWGSEGLYYDGKGEAVGVNTVQGDLMDSTRLGLFAKGGWDIDERRRLQLTANYFQLRGKGGYRLIEGDLATRRPATSVRGRPVGAPSQNQATTVTLDYRDADLAGGILLGQLYWSDFAGRYGGSVWKNFWGPGTAWTDESQNRSRKIGAKLGWTRGQAFGWPLQLNLGVDLNRDVTRQELVRANLDWVPQTRYESLAPFLQAEWQASEHVAISGGVRYEMARLRVDDFTTLPIYGNQQVGGGTPRTTQWLPNFGVVWEPRADLRLYASYSQGYTVADIGRVLRSINRPGQRVDDLVDLTPVVADNREIGVEASPGHWQLRLSVYQSDAKLGSRLQYENLSRSYRVLRQRTRIRGVEASADWQWRPGSRLGVAFAGASGRYDGDGDSRLDSDLPGTDIGADRVLAYWQQQWRPGFSTRVQAQQVLDRRFQVSGAPTTRFDGYTTLDLQANVRLPLGQLAIGVQNLFDRSYFTYYAQTVQRTDNYVRGRGRVLSLGWSYRF